MDDLISRQAAIEALDEYIEEYSYDLDENGYHNPKWCAMQEAKMTIQRLPSAERHGQWKDIPFTARWICSNCDYISEFASFKYCPDCGARMDLEDEE